MQKPIIVKIYGNVSSGKTPWAKTIKKRAINKSLSVCVSDSELFLFDDHFEKKMAEIMEYIVNKNIDIGILTIGTGNDRSPFKIEIEPFGSSSFHVMNILIGNDI